MTPPGMLMAGGMGPGAVGPMGGPMPQNRGAGGGGGGGSRGARGGRGRNFPGPVPAMGGPGMPGTGHAIPGTKRPDFVPGSLFIGDLSDKTTADTLRSYCSTWGDLKECRVIEGKGYGFVVYERPESAIAFLEHRQQNGHILDGVTIDPRAQAPKGQVRAGRCRSFRHRMPPLAPRTQQPRACRLVSRTHLARWHLSFCAAACPPRPCDLARSLAGASTPRRRFSWAPWGT